MMVILLKIKTLRRRLWFVLPPVTITVLMVLMMRWDGQGQTGDMDGFVEGLAGNDSVAVKQLTQHSLLAPSTLPYNLHGSPHYLFTARGDTWPFVHHYVTRLFAGERGGFFVEAGALDGQMLSNTLWLEQELGWTGLLVEPDSTSYSTLLTKHRKAWNSNTCISRTGLTESSVHVSLSPIFRYVVQRSSPWYMRGSSYQLGVSMNTHKYDKFLNTGEKSYYTVKCFPLITYLRALNVSKIDLLSLDTQGSEVDILKTIPWHEVEVRVVVVEIIESSLGSACEEYMKRHGFVLVGQYNDYVFVRSGDPALARLQSQERWKLVVADPEND